MPSKIDLEQMSMTRLEEVKVLYDKQLYDGAYYLAGYVVELALKARICKILDIDYPDRGEMSKSFKTHNLETLIGLGGLYNKFNAMSNANANFQANWSLISVWTEQFRYEPIGTKGKTDIQQLISAIEDPKDGVLTWIKQQW